MTGDERTDRHVHWVLRALVFGSLALSALGASAASVVLNANTTIGADNTQFEGDALTVDGVELVIEGAHAFASLALVNGATLTHGVAAASPPELTIAGDLTIDADSRIDVSGKGLRSNISRRSPTIQLGGSHGGYGNAFSSSRRETYGSLTAPASYGTGTYYRGGGAIRLVVANVLRVEGMIVADGKESTTYYNDANEDFYIPGGASGGSIWIETGTLAGAGEIRANGGFANDSSGGGGGRIAIAYRDIESFPLTSIRAYGGYSFKGYDDEEWWRGSAGGAGTIFLKDTLLKARRVIVHNPGASISHSGSTPLTGTVDAPVFVKTGVLEVGANSVLDRLDVMPGARAIWHSNVRVREAIVDGGTLELDGVQAASRLELLNGATLRNAALPAASSDARLSLQVNDVLVDATSAIDLTARGLGSTPNLYYRNGASHGGTGGFVDGSLNPIYGDPERPFDFGTGTDNARGGGQLKLTAGTLQLDGAIRANGARSNSRYGGGGSGGSLWLDVGVIRGAGVVHARGSDPGSPSNGGGGGGRVALYHHLVLDGFDPSTQISVDGGTASSYPGAPGTVHIEAADVSPRVLSVHPVALTNENVARIEVEFNTHLDAGTINASDLLILGTSNSIVPVSANKASATVLAFELAEALYDDVYTLSIGPDLANLNGRPMDQDADGQSGEPVDDVFVATLTVDREAPPPLQVDALDAAPTVHYVADLLVTVTGTRAAVSAVAVNGTEHTPQATGAFAVDIALEPGENALSFTAVDVAGNASVALDFVIFADREAPALSAHAPSGFTNQVPEAVELTVDDVGSGLALAASTVAILHNGIVQSGSITLTSAGVRFVPHAGFVEGSWGLSAMFVDAIGNGAEVDLDLFELDYTSPASPDLDAVPPRVTVPWVTLSGTREAGAEVHVNGELLAVADDATRFSGIAPLVPGSNQLAVTQTDAAGNISVPAQRVVEYDDIVPGPVAFTVDPNRDGQTLVLDWSGYDEVANGGDIASYRIYSAATPFTDIAAASLVGNTPGGTRRFYLSGLERDVPVAVAVIAVDQRGQFNAQVTSVTAVPVASVVLRGSTTIEDLDTRFEGYHITVDGGWLTIEGPHAFASLALVNGATLTHGVAAASPPELTIAGDLTIDADSRINVSGRGLNTAPGSERNGGSHGGYAGAYDSNRVAPYGSLTAPVSYGTGTYYRGGGAIRLVVANVLRLDGVIAADGVADTNYYTGGGSGGSIWIETGTLAGAGEIRANGGSSTRYAAGGGGRVAVYYDALGGFDLDRIHAHAAPGNGPSRISGAGTVYLSLRGGTPEARVRGGTVTTEVTPVEPFLGTLRVANARATVAGTGYGGAVVEPGGRLDAGANSILDSLDVASDARAVLRANVLVRDAIVVDGGTLELDGVQAASRLELLNGATLRNATLPAASSDARLSLQVNDVFVDATSAIDLTARGLDSIPNLDHRNGASHGGTGGLVYGSLNPIYGDPERPFDFGTGQESIRGGGQLKLTAGTLQLEGALYANGGSVAYYGGSSGGSIWLDVGVIRGAGVVHARGGDPGSTSSGGGGGGRVALYHLVLDGFDPSTQISVVGGTASSYPGAPGTVHVEAVDVSPQVLSVRPADFTNEDVTRIEVVFNTHLDAATIDVSDLRMVDTSGSIIPVSAIEAGPTVLAFELAEALYDDVYTLSIGPDLASFSGRPMDQDADGQGGEPVDDIFVTTLTVDREAPPPLEVDAFEAAPTVNYVADLLVTVTGTRAAASAVAVNGTEHTPQATGAFAVDIALEPGENARSLTAVDAAGNASLALDFVIFADREAPTLSAYAPSGFMNQAPEAIELTVEDAGSGFVLPASTLDFRRNGIVQNGTLTTSTPTNVRFVPHAGFVEGRWGLAATLVDAVGNGAEVDLDLFEIDHTPPAPPDLDAVPPRVTVPRVTLSGTREAGAEVHVNGELLAAADDATRFSGTARLVRGSNQLAVTQTDAAGNTGAPAQHAVEYDDIAPRPVVLTVDPNGDGQTLMLDWSSYDEVANGGDIASYRIYSAATPFTDIAAASLVGNTPGGTRRFSLAGLERAVPVAVAVIAVDQRGQFDAQVTSVTAVPVASVVLRGSTTIEDLDTRFEGYHITVDGGWLTIEGSHAFASLALVNGATLTHGVAAASPPELTIAGDLTIDADSWINVSGRGLNTAPGSDYNGGSHGGYAGAYDGDRMAPYGSLTAPVSYGTGTYYRGGGAIHLVVANALRLDGVIAADGAASTNSYRGGGSGGSIWIETGTLTGAGEIWADGGSSYNRAAGAGGRIGVYYDVVDGFDLDRVHAHAAASSSAAQISGAGTVYLLPRSGTPEARVRGGIATTEITPVEPFVGTLRVASARATVAGTGYSGAVVELGGFLDAADGTVFTGTVRAEGGGSVRAEGALTGDRLELAEGSHAGQSSAAGSQAHPLTTLVFDSVEVDETSRIDMSGRGLNTAPGNDRNGGSHGGYAGAYDGDRMAPYGSLTAPVSYGTGTYYRGGGAIHLVVANALRLDGVIAADGVANTNYYTGGGSGGSIWIETGTLSGAGEIRANGGSSTHYAAGGGGRVAVYYDALGGFDLDRIHAHAAPGNGPSRISGAGTVYLSLRGGTPEARVRGGTVTTEVTPVEPFLGTLRVANARATVAGTGYGGAVVEPGGRLDAGANSILDSLDVASDARAVLRANVLVRDAIVVDGGTLELDGVQAASRLELLNGATLRNAILPAASSHARLALRVKDVLVDATSAIDLTGRGLGSTPNLYYRNGASHGGLGGLVGHPLNPTFGNPAQPFDFGTGTSSARGGGQLKLTAGTLQLDGALRANGARSNSSHGGGSGGSLWLDVGVIRGAGVVHARGGDPGSSSNGGGGGGRVALYHLVRDGFDPSAQISVHGGTAASYPGAPGTVHIEAVDVSPQVLAVRPADFTNEDVTRIEVEFNTHLDAGTIDASDLLILGTSNSIVPVSATEAGPAVLAFELAEALYDDVYTLSIGPDLASLSGRPMDQDADGQGGEPVDDVFVATLTVDREAPPPLEVDALEAAPTIHYVADLLVTVTGTRAAVSAVAVNGAERTPQATGAFTVDIALEPGENALSLTAVDAAGNASPALDFVVFADREAPALSAHAPTGLTNQVPEAIELTVEETGSGFALPAATLDFRRNGIVQGGEITLTEAGVRFVPHGGFVEGGWHLSGTLVDAVDNRIDVDLALFDLDYTPPAPPGLDPVPAQVTVPYVTLGGTREAGAAVHVNGALLAAADASTRFSGTVPLVPGANSLAITQTDAAGNTGAAAERVVVFDDRVPGPVAPAVDPNGDGRTLTLDWSGYDATANGDDIAIYEIYRAAAPFTHIAAAERVGTTPAGTRQFSLASLERAVPVALAVVAVDQQGQFDGQVTSVTATPVDSVPPAEVSAITVVNQADGARFAWQAPADEDFAGVRVSADGGAEVELDAATTDYVVSGLAAATRTELRIRTLDADGNASGGVTGFGVSWLANPQAEVVEALSGRVRLDWDAVAPTDLVAAYTLYAETVPFTDISGLSPRLVVPVGTTDASVTGLTNDTPYHFAVATVNLAGGSDPSVVPVTATPRADREGPVITALAYNGVAFTDAITLTQPGPWTLAVTDPSGIGSIEFFVDDVLVGSDRGGREAARYELDLTALADGDHSFAVHAHDTLGNSSAVVRLATVALAPPAAPTLTEPADGQRTNSPTLALRGSTVAGTEVQVRVDGVAQGTLTAAPGGAFVTSVALEEGENRITVRARYAGRDFGAESAPLTVILDTAQPDAPLGLVADSRPLGEIRLAWGAPADAEIAGYDLYRAEVPFASISAATKVNGARISGGGYTDMPPADGRYVYRVVALNVLGTASAPSDLTSADADSTLPTAALSYAASGPVDAATGRMAPGTVAIELRTSEPLLTRPYLALSPEGGVPSVLELIRDFTDPTRYRTSWQLTPEVPTGTVFAVFSAFDAVGNRGTELTAGASIEVDTRGPQVLELSVNPPAPIRNNPQEDGVPATVEVLLRLDEDPAGGAPVRLVPTLDGAPVDAWTAGLPLVWDALSVPGEPRYRATFELPLEAGLDAAGQPQPQTLSFTYRAEDDLGNVEDGVPPGLGVQVYQGDLPPLAVPFGLSAAAEAGGQVRLAWRAVAGASGYRLFRQAPGETALTALTDLAGGTTLEFLDDGRVGAEGSAAGLAEGIYRYAIASTRRDNGQISHSGTSDPVTVTPDATAPGTPEDFTAELTGAGVVLRWVPPADETDVLGLRYHVYRLATPEGEAVDLTGVVPLRDGIPQPLALDTSPSNSAFTYVVTALDAAGNESPPTAPRYVNADLLPVSALSVLLDETGPAVLGFRSGGGAITGFAVAIDGEARAELLPAAAGASRFVDEGYPAARSGAPIERHYAVTAVDTNGVRSLAHALLLPALTVTRSEVDDLGRPAPVILERNVMNRLWFRVANGGASDAFEVRLEVGVDDEQGGTIVARTHRSDRFAVPAGGFTLVPVVIGGYDGLDALGDLRLQLTQAPVQGDAVTIRQRASVSAVDAALVSTLTTEDLLRGGTGTVRFSVENTSAVTTEIVLGHNGGASPDVRLRLEDADGNVLATSAVRQLTGGVVNLSNGFTVARIEPGATFRSGPLALTVPQGAPDEVVVRLVVDRLRYRSGTEDEVVIQGLGATRRATLVETPYAGEVTEIDPLIVAAGAEDRRVRIRGRAVSRRSGAAQPSVPVQLVLRVAGFEQTETLVTDGNGDFEYTFAPGAGDSGRYAVSVVHPDLVDRPEQGVFTVESFRLRPSSFGGNVVRGVTQRLQTTVSAGAATELEGLRLAYRAEDQPGGRFAAGLEVSVDGPRDLAPGQSAQLGFHFTGGADAADSGRFVLRLVSEDAAGPLGAVTVDYRLTEATPALTRHPSFIELGTARNAQATGVFRVKNVGYAPVLAARVRLEQADGSPAPAWVFLSSSLDLGTLAVGEERVLEVTAAPGAEVPEADYTFRAVIDGERVGAQVVPIYVAVTESGTGGVLVHVSDLYTATLDEHGQPILGLAGARIKLQNEQVHSQVYEGRTDAFGNLLLEALPAGHYVYRASAFDHQDASGRLRVQPGVVGSQEVFLTNELVTVEWSVVEIPVEDRYEVTLEATFRTNVPAAVIMLSPLSVNLPRLDAGETYYGEFTLTNHGLIAADNTRARLPQNDDYLQFEFLRDPPERLLAGEIVTIPYRITALRDFDAAADADATGAGSCVSYTYYYEVVGEYICAVGETLPCGSRMVLRVSESPAACGSAPPRQTELGFSFVTANTTSSSGIVVRPESKKLDQQEGAACARIPLAPGGLQCMEGSGGAK